ncbi:MAG: alanine--tRNA ligase, partial [Dehalococcoidia bacterium]|nr:alanine--tRNA ligase [Dehalococcoidia bacterium]
QVAAGLRTTVNDVPVKLENISSSLNSSNKIIASLQRELSAREVDNLINNYLTEVNKVKVISARVPSLSKEALMEMGDMLKAKMQSGVVVLGTVYDDKPFFIATGTPDIIKRGVHCGKLVKQVAQIAGGSGGGKPDMAQAGARDKDKIDEALKAAPNFIRELLTAGHE